LLESEIPVLLQGVNVKKQTIVIDIVMVIIIFLLLPALTLFDLYWRKGWDGMVQTVRFFLETTF